MVFGAMMSPEVDCMRRVSEGGSVVRIADAHEDVSSLERAVSVERWSSF